MIIFIKVYIHARFFKYFFNNSIIRKIILKFTIFVQKPREKEEGQGSTPCWNFNLQFVKNK